MRNTAHGARDPEQTEYVTVMGQRHPPTHSPQPSSADGRTPASFTAASFRVPTSYLMLLLGKSVGEKLLAQHGRKVVVDKDAISSIAFLTFCLQRMRTTGEESYGIAARPVPKGTLGILMAAASHGNNFAEALSRFAAAARLLRPDIAVKYGKGRRSLNIVLGYDGRPSARKELMLETFAVSIHCAFRWLTARPLRPQQVTVAPPTGAFQWSLLIGLLGCPVVQRGSGVTLSYELSDGSLPLAQVKYDAWAAQEFREFMGLLDEAAARRNARMPEDAPGIVADVRRVISAGGGSESEVARRLSLSPATLRRRLASSGSSFRTLADEAQRNIAATLLMTDTSLEDIAAASRYSDVRSFRRACLRWFGMSPAAYRRARR